MDEKRPLLASNSNITIRPASFADARAISSLFVECFRGKTFWNQFYAPVNGEAATPAECRARDRDVYRSRLAITHRHLCNPQRLVYLAYTEESNEQDEQEPAAMAIWGLEGGEEAAHNVLQYRRRQLTPFAYVLRTWYKVIDAILPRILPDWLQTWLWYRNLGVAYLERRRRLMEDQDRLEEAYISDEDKKRGYMDLVMLATRPGKERRGIGALLLKQGIDKAVADGVAIILSATDVGKPLYTRMGFVDLVQKIKSPPGAQYTETLMRHPGGTHA